MASETTAVLDESRLLELFKSRGALLEGHFILSSGLHSNRYLQSALLLQDPPVAEELGRALAERFPENVNGVVSPAVGGLIIGHEVARAKGCRAIFVEKDEKGRPTLRRGIEMMPDEKFLVIEDVLTTGLSTKEVLDIVERSHAVVSGVGCIVNRSGMREIPALGPDWGKAVRQLLTLTIETWAAPNCPLCKKGIPAVKPGSRKS